jgi:hypothetical protein
VDAELEGVSGRSLFAFFSAGPAGLLGIAAVGRDLLVGCHESGFLFEMEWARRGAAREIGRGISNPIQGYRWRNFVKTGGNGEVVEERGEINFDVL